MSALLREMLCVPAVGSRWFMLGGMRSGEAPRSGGQVSAPADTATRAAHRAQTGPAPWPGDHP